MHMLWAKRYGFGALVIYVYFVPFAGAPQPEIIWLKDKVVLSPSAKHVMSFDTETGTCRLTIVNAEPSDVGVYSCRAENLAGKATCTANVVVVRKYTR